MSGTRTACALLVLAWVGGCAHNPHSHGGQFVAEHRPGADPVEVKAPYQAVYALHQWRSPPPGEPPRTWIPEKEVEELYVRGLGRWEPVGFRRGPDGELLAVAGAETIPLAEGRYCWHITPASEYRGSERLLHETGDNLMAVGRGARDTVEGVVALPFVIVGTALMIPVFGLCGLAMFAN